MFVIDDAKLPPPTPARQATITNVGKDVPGCMTVAAMNVGISSRAALTTVQFRPPNLATAKVYGSRRIDPTRVGAETRKNFPAASTWYSGPMKSTSTDHRVHTEKPMCSDSTENSRFR